MGVVLNRPSAVTVAEAVPQLGEAVGDDEPVYVGGPVQQSSIVVLAEFLDSSNAGLLVLDSIGFPASDADLDGLAGTTARSRVFAGYAGWSAAAAGVGDRGRRLDLPRRRARAHLLGAALRAVEDRAGEHGRQLRSGRPHAPGPQRQLRTVAARRAARGALVACAAGGPAVRAGSRRGAGGARGAPRRPPTAARRSALLVFAPVDERSLASLKGMSVGILSAAEGGPSAAQLRLDITQGARLASGSYGSPPGSLQLLTRGRRRGSRAGPAELARARGAPGELRPGLLASALGGAAYLAAVAGERPRRDRGGRRGRAGGGRLAGCAGRRSWPARDRLLGRWPLVVATVGAGRQGRRALQQLAAARGPRELMIVVQSDPASRPSRLLWVGAAGLGGRRPGELTSSDTQQRGLISSTDIAPTILAHEQVAIPASVQGSPVRVEGAPGRRRAAEHDRAPGRDRRAAPARAGWRCWPPGRCCWRPARARRPHAGVRCASARSACCGRPWWRC